MNIPKNAVLMMTIQVASISSLRVDQDTFLSSTVTSDMNLCIFPTIACLSLTGLVGFEPTTHGFGDRCSASWSYRPSLSVFVLFFKFTVKYVLAAKSTIFLNFDFFGMLFLILRGTVIDPLTLSALKLNRFTHNGNLG